MVIVAKKSSKPCVQSLGDSTIVLERADIRAGSLYRLNPSGILSSLVLRVAGSSSTGKDVVEIVRDELFTVVRVIAESVYDPGHPAVEVMNYRVEVLTRDGVLGEVCIIDCDVEEVENV